jgi:hypothetical protein
MPEHLGLSAFLARRIVPRPFRSRLVPARSVAISVAITLFLWITDCLPPHTLQRSASTRVTRSSEPELPFPHGKGSGWNHRPPLAEVDAPRHRPALQHIIVSGWQQCVTTFTELTSEILLLENDRHTVVHRGHKVVRLSDDHRARFQSLAGCLISPFVP